MMHPHYRANFPWLQAHRPKCHVNPVDSLRRQPLNYVHNLTSPKNQKEVTTPGKHVLLPENSCENSCENGCRQSLELNWNGVASG